MKTNEIICGHAPEVLKGMPDQSVHCCVTSPPYWGLRDYGTATWEGGSVECDHAVPIGRKGGNAVGTKQTTNPGSYGYREWLICGKCGAKRVDSQLGLEKTPEEYVEKMVEIFREVRRVLRDDGTLWLNLGDSYATGTKADRQEGNKSFGANTAKAQTVARVGTPEGLKTKDLVGIPWRVAFALQADGWYLRSDIIWHKPNPMPESVTDRPTKSHEYIFLLSKSKKYYYDSAAIADPSARPGDFQVTTKTEGLGDGYDGHRTRRGLLRGIVVGDTRNKRTVWTIATQPFPQAHFAVFPEELIIPCIKAGTSEAGCCPKCGTPLSRNTERSEEKDSSAKGSRFDKGKTVARDGGDRTQKGERFTKREVGWFPSCECYGQFHKKIIGSGIHAKEVRYWRPHGDVPPTEPCIVLDPFIGSGTTGLVAAKLGRQYLGIELNPDYCKLAEKRLKDKMGLFL